MFFLEVMAEDDVTTKVFEDTMACACVDMLIEVDVCKTVSTHGFYYAKSYRCVYYRRIVYFEIYKYVIL